MMIQFRTNLFPPHSLLDFYRHGQEAKSYKRIINSCRMFWNMSQPMLFSQKGCDSLVPHLLELLEIVSLVSSRRRKSVSDH